MVKQANKRHFAFILKTDSADISNRQHLSAVQVSPLPALNHQAKFRKLA
jgi:hypothetical protein